MSISYIKKETKHILLIVVYLQFSSAEVGSVSNFNSTFNQSIYINTNIKQWINMDFFLFQTYHSNIDQFSSFFQIKNNNNINQTLFFFQPHSFSYPQPNTYLAAQPLFFNVLLRCFTFIISSLQSPRSFSCRLRSLTLAQTSSSSLMSNGLGDIGGFWQKVTLLVLFQYMSCVSTAVFFSLLQCVVLYQY